MQSRDFCFWLQGFFELNGEAAALSAGQAAMIRRHLDMVFQHEIEPGTSLRERTDAPAPVAPVPAPDPEPAPEYDPEQPPLVPPAPLPLC